MAGGSAKKQAAANEQQIKVLNYGALGSTLLAALLRLLLGRTSATGIVLSVVVAVPMVLLTRFLVSTGTPRRSTTGELIAPGDDLNAGGVTEYASDVVYLSWLALVLSALFGERAWFILFIVPAFAVYKLWGFAAPMLGLAGIRLPSFGAAATDTPDLDDQQQEAPSSKRQEKLRKRMEKGDPRVRQTERR